jgi:hypothetical protein
MKTEQTLNSAAQSVLDEIKRVFDDKFVSTYYEREDLTLIVRVFDPSFKKKLLTVESYSSMMSHHLSSNNISEPLKPSESTYNTMIASSGQQSYISSTMSDTLREDEASLCTEQPDDEAEDEISSKLDPNGHVMSYINMDELNSVLSLSENKPIIDELCAQLRALSSEK